MNLSNQVLRNFQLVSGQLTAPLTISNSIFIGSRIVDPRQPITYVNCQFINSVVSCVAWNSKFLDCLFAEKGTQWTTQWSSGVTLQSCSFIRTLRGPTIQTRPGYSVTGLLIDGLFLENVTGGVGHEEWFLAEGPGGTFANSTIRNVSLRNCPGAFTLSNLTATNILLQNVSGDMGGQDGGVYCYGDLPNGTMSNLKFDELTLMGGRGQLDPCVTSSMWTNVLWDSPSSPLVNPPVLTAKAGTHSLANVKATNVPAGWTFQSGFTVAA